MAEKKEKLSTEPYKGVRDFYPEDMAAEKYLFSVMRRAVESFGYVEYGASILEPTELYASKTSEEIVNEQTYTFVDRGGRSVTLRPEMTPTLARMVAAKRRELGFPLRWYSIPNVFRYERPQRGRLREHWQLNCDLFGISGIEAETELIMLAHRIMLDFGAKESDFEIRVGSRAAVQKIAGGHKLSKEKTRSLFSLIDRGKKISDDDFKRELNAFGIQPKELFPHTIPKNIQELILTLAKAGIKNVQYDPTTVRGFDYYTDVVFEVFDTNPKNNRSLFGGGRYDNLLSAFGQESIPAVGFGMGDVTLRDFIETRNLLPRYRSTTDLYICVADDAGKRYSEELAEKLRAEGLNVIVDTTGRGVGDQKKTAVKQSIPFVAYLRGRDGANRSIPVENTVSGKEETLAEERIAEFLHAARA